MINAVFDSSVLIAAFLTPKGLSRSLIQRAQVGQFKLSISQEIVAETRQKLIKSNKLRERYRYADEEVAYFINGLRTLSIVVQDLPAIQVVRDSSDDIIMATAIKAEADYLLMLRSRGLAKRLDPVARNDHSPVLSSRTGSGIS